MVLTESESEAETENSGESDYLNGFVCLTKMVRDQYVKYLERLLEENVRAWRQNLTGKKVLGCEVVSKIKQSVNELEHKAIKSCMMAQIYQRAMMKIVANVRRDTQNKRLEKTLQGLLDSAASGKNLSTHYNDSFSFDKATQTETKTVAAFNINENNINDDGDHGFVSNNNNNNDDDNHKFLYNNDNHDALTFQQKINIWQEKIYEENLTPTNGMCPTSNNQNLSDDTKYIIHRKRRRLDHSLSPTTTTSLSSRKEANSSKIRQYTPPQHGGNIVTNDFLSSLSPPPLAIVSPSSSKPIINEEEKQNNSSELNIANSPKQGEFEEVEDDVARELALLFGDEKTDLDDIFGIDPNSANDDPQMNSILQEIENATKAQKNNNNNNKNNKSNKKVYNDDDNDDDISNVIESIAAFSPEPALISSSPTLEAAAASNSTVDLSNSIWPCEIYYQKRQLSASLCRLLDEDLRWHEAMKWKFLELFGEDSDDEFAMYSPSIDLDDVLKGSCIKRITPWVVQYLMKPLNEGLIANRFLFKKLARKLANNIITINQYPDKEFIKESIEEFFCIKPSIQNIEDLNEI